jgi:4-diphosphocytidyl-2-C-methyl-D-erythritol kinase
MMETLYESAYAKLNLTLDVLGKRPDGYHDLKSVMQTISIRDDIEIDIGTQKPWTLKCDKESIPTDERNLAWKAAKVYLDAVKKNPDGIEIRITKRIPSEAGMGGGSADAAAVLRALNRYYDYPLSVLALAELGASVGSDVPFCTLCGTAMVEGRGERLRKLPDLPDCVFVVCKPDFSVSTPET